MSRSSVFVSLQVHWWILRVKIRILLLPFATGTLTENVRQGTVGEELSNTLHNLAKTLPENYFTDMEAFQRRVDKEGKKRESYSCNEKLGHQETDN